MKSKKKARKLLNITLTRFFKSFENGKTIGIMEEKNRNQLLVQKSRTTILLALTSLVNPGEVPGTVTS
jgi:hypothetical protein